jgi:hypothetical protein
MKKITFVSAVFAVFSFTQVFSQATKGEPILEKMTFTCTTKETSPSKKAKEQDDEFSFRGGKFKSKYFTEEFKVPTKPYEIMDVDTATGSKIITWQCEAPVDDDNKVTFSGKVEGKSISGTVQWTVKNKPKRTVEYEFTGELKEKKAKTPTK